MSIILDFSSPNYNGGTSISVTYLSNEFNSSFTPDGLGYTRKVRNTSFLRKLGLGKSGADKTHIDSNQNLLPMYDISFELVLASADMDDIFEIFDAQYKSSSLGLDWTLTLSDFLLEEPLTVFLFDEFFSRFLLFS